MAEKDITEKILESYNDVFADIVNVLLFDGEQVIKPDELEDQAPRSAYKADGKIREIERDVAKRWTKNNIRFACIGLENQSEPDPDMPLRVISYDGAEYRAQISKETRSLPRYPVVTLVLYFGHTRRWDAPKSLQDALTIPHEFGNLIPEYPIRLFEIAWLDPETVKKFRSDFRVVADFFVQKRINGNKYRPSRRAIKYVQETLQLLRVMTGDDRYEGLFTESELKGGTKTMCDVLDRVEAKGMKKGKAEGKESERLSNIRSLMETMNLSSQQAMNALKIPASEQKKYEAKLK